MSILKSLRIHYLVALVLGFSVTACSTTNDSPEAYAEGVPIEDPLEDVNRTIFEINEGIDKVILEPVARGYRFVTPKGIRQGVSNFLRNLKSPIVIGNEILQGDIEGAGNATARMVINTLAGFGGILDLAEAGGIEYQQEDMGQTFAKWGIGNGPYLVLPLMGPSTVRDGVGMAIDSYVDPIRLYLFNTDQEAWHYARIGATVVSQREELLDVLDDLRRNSFDYYAAVRSAYYQRRQALINDEDPDKAAYVEIPDYD